LKAILLREESTGFLWPLISGAPVKFPFVRTTLKLKAGIKIFDGRIRGEGDGLGRLTWMFGRRVECELSLKPLLFQGGTLTKRMFFGVAM
jgi:hypothetical protein